MATQSDQKRLIKRSSRLSMETIDSSINISVSSSESRIAEEKNQKETENDTVKPEDTNRKASESPTTALITEVTQNTSTTFKPTKSSQIIPHKISKSGRKPSFIAGNSFDQASLTTNSKRMSKIGPLYPLKYTGRKQSIFSMGAKTSDTGLSMQHNSQTRRQYSNTYIMSPRQDEIMRVAKIREQMMIVFQRHLGSLDSYGPNRAVLAKTLTESIKKQVKETCWPKRHKLVCQVILGQDGGQSMQIASRCLWDISTDNYVQATYKTGNLWVVAGVFGIYYS